MRPPPGSRTAQIIALWQNGELARAVARAATRQAVAAEFGMTAYALSDAIDRARRLGHEIPSWELLRRNPVAVGTSGDFADEEPTRPVSGQAATGGSDFGQPNIGMHTSTVQHESSTERWPHVEAFDAVGGNDMLPAHGPGVRRSTLLRDGEPVLQWVKNPGGDRHDAMLDAIRRLGDEMPRAEVAAVPERADEDLLAVYPMGDPHLGMLAWAPEAGENFDTAIAERQLFEAADRLVARAPNAKHALVLNLGDYFHADGPQNTTTGGTRVDVDGRWAKVLAAGIRTMRRIIDRALEKHEHVTVINEIGNHDTNSSVMLSLALAQFYEREPRVKVDTSPESFHWYRFGACLIGAHHGHRVKFADLGAVMACDRPQDWGETKHRRIYVGHVHHDTVKELRGVTIESVRTLAPSDAWHRGQGYRSGHDMKMDVWHARRGHVERHIVSIDEIRETA